MGDTEPLGFGGLSYADVGYSGAPGTLAIASESDNGGPACSTNCQFTIDADNNIVLNPAYFFGSYGGPPPNWTAPAVLKLTGASFSASVTINKVASAAYVTVMCQSLSGGNCVDADGYPDSASSSQLNAVLQRPLKRPFTIYQRNTPQWGPTVSQAFAQGAFTAMLSVPASGYPGSGPLIITSDRPAAVGGGAPWGLVCASAGADINLNIHLLNISHYTDYPNAAGAGTNNTAMFTNCGNRSLGYGIEEDYGSYAIGPDVTQPYRMFGFLWYYQPSAVGVSCGIDHTANPGPSNCLAATVTHSTFVGLATGIRVTNEAQPGPTHEPFVGADVEWNTFLGQLGDSIDVNPSAVTKVMYNFMYLPSPCCGAHADSGQYFPSFTGYSTNIGTFAYNIAIRGAQNLGSIISTVNVTNSGSGYTNGSYAHVIVTGGSGKLGSGQVTVAGGAVTAFVPDTIEGDGAGYKVGDVIGLDPTCCGGGGSGFAATVATISYHRGDFQGLPFFNNGLPNPVTPGDHGAGATVINNIVINADDANGFYLGSVDNIVADNNLYLEDVQTVNNGFGGHAAGALNIIALPSNGSGTANGGHFDFDATNGWNLSGMGQSPAPTCLPGSIGVYPNYGETCNVVSTAACTTGAACPAYTAIAPGFDTSQYPANPTRATIIKMLTPVAGASNPVYSAGAYAWPLWPPDNAGEVCWATTAVFDPTKTCAQQGTSVAQ